MPFGKQLLLSLVAAPLLTFTVSSARADDTISSDSGAGAWPLDEPLVLQKTVSVQGAGLGAFDISFVDSRLGLYVLADRTNASVDLFDSEAAQFVGRVGSQCPAGNPAPHYCFTGVQTSISGPRWCRGRRSCRS